MRDGRSLARVLGLERSTRLPEILTTLRALRPATRRGIPALMTGDFNTPSHLDWTPAVDAVRADVRYPVAWPVTRRDRVLSRSRFWVVDRGARPHPRVTAGDHIRVTWRNAPGYRRDWIGIYRRGDADLYNDYLTFAYTGATVAGKTTIADRLRPGRYVVRLMTDDGYAELARAAFRVRP